MRLRLVLLGLVGAGLACNSVLPSASRVWEAGAPANVKPPTPTLGPVGNVRVCDFVPGVSLPAAPLAVAAATPTPYPLPPLPANTSVAGATTQQQVRLFQKLWDTVDSDYLDPHFNGRDWPAIGQKYRALIEKGLTDDDFYYAMDLMLAELGDDHSQFESPQAAQASDREFAGQNDYVGIGIVWNTVPEAQRGVIVTTFPGGPAAEAGLRSHDAILAVDGEPVIDAQGYANDRLRGPEGSEVTLTMARPGGDPFDVKLTRRRITGALPIDSCLMPQAGIGYIFLPGLDDDTIPEQVRHALRELTAGGPLKGLVLDNRQNGGGEETVLTGVLQFLMQGHAGDFVSRTDTRPLTIDAVDVGGSQAVPVVVLVDVDTVSYGEVMSGVLQNSDHARVVGRTTLGNVETLWGYSFDDGSRAWIAHEAFRPLGQPLGIWEETGIVPDVSVPTRWDLFTEATDPALATAVELLTSP